MSGAKATSLTVGQLAKRAGVNAQTIYYYERSGILPETRRSNAGYRQYDLQALQRLRFVKRAQEMGFSLKEVTELLGLRVQRRASCNSVRQRAEEKLKLVQAKIEDLQRIEETLQKLVSSCRAEQTTSNCPILEALDPREDHEVHDAK